MKKSLYAAAIYTTLALASGVFARTYLDQIMHFEGDTQIRVLHTHLFAMGMLFFLVVLALDKLFDLSKTKVFNWFFWLYNIGFGLGIVMMLVIGITQVQGLAESPALAGVAGLGHMLLTAGIVCLFVALYKRVIKH